MSRLAAAALRRGVVASGFQYSSNTAAFSPLSSRLFSTEASGADAGSQDDFLKPSGERLVYGKFYSVITGGGRLGTNMLKNDIIHYLDKCELSLDDVKVDYNREYYPMAALLKFRSMESYKKALRQTNQANQGRLYRLDRVNPDEWDLAQSYDGKAILLRGVPRTAELDDIERFLCGTNFEPPPFESFVRPGIQEPIKMVLVKFRSKADATNTFIAKNRTFCLNSPINMRFIQ